MRKKQDRLRPVKRTVQSGLVEVQTDVWFENTKYNGELCTWFDKMDFFFLFIDKINQKKR